MDATRTNHPDPASFRAAVAADHADASRAGVEILAQGGNAVDAAVATSFALSVTRPYSCGVGGGGFLLARLVSHPRLAASRDRPLEVALDYRETAPHSVDAETFAGQPDHASQRGPRSVAIPGHVAGMAHALQRWGTMSLAQVLQPAIRLARTGLVVDRNYAKESKEIIAWISEDPDRRAQDAFLWERFLGKGVVREGDVIRLDEQANLFERIAREGPDGFYAGPHAEALLRAVNHALPHAHLTQQDLATYRVRERTPFRASFTRPCGDPCTLLTMPPPSSGGIVLAQVLTMLTSRSHDLASALGGPTGGHNSPAYVHLLCECLKHAFADRARWLGDTDQVPDVPIDELLSPARLAAAASSIDLSHTRTPAHYGVLPPITDSAGTSHLSVVDEQGNAVACTETINLIFGSFVAVPEFAYVLNDTVDDFLTQRGRANAFGLLQSERNLPAPGKRPLSAMTPTIACDASGVLALSGASGGPRIITSTLQSLLNVLLFDMPAADAVGAPRFHHQWMPETLMLEAPLLASPLAPALRGLGHSVGPRDPIGAVQLIRSASAGRWQAASDPRKGGLPAGLP